MKDEDETQESLTNPLSPASSIETSSEDDFDKLIEIQARKSELYKKREALLHNQTQLRNDCEKFKALLSTYREQKLQQETKKKLEFFLHQNDHEYLKLSAPDKAASFVLENLGTLPSNNWDLRRQFTQKLYPHMEVEACSTATKFTTSESELEFHFTLKGVRLPGMNITVCVSDEEITSLTISNWEKISATFTSLCDSFGDCVVRDYVPHCKLDLLVFSYQSLSEIQYKRVSALKAILIEFEPHVSHPLPKVIKEKNLEDFLLCIPYIQLTIKSRTKLLFVRLHWGIRLIRKELGEFESDINFSVLNEDLEHIRVSNDAFKRLLRTYGVVEAFRLMVFNLLS